MEDYLLYCKENLNGSSSGDVNEKTVNGKRKSSTLAYDDEDSSNSSSVDENVYISKQDRHASPKSNNEDEEVGSDRIPKNNKKKVRELIVSKLATENENFHRILPLNVLEKYHQVLGTNKRARLRCKLCHEKTSFFCAKCTNGDEIFALCSPLKVPLCNCFYEHVTPMQYMSTSKESNRSNQASSQFFSPILNDPRVAEILDKPYTNAKNQKNSR
jgi:hypothetical protein